MLILGAIFFFFFYFFSSCFSFRFYSFLRSLALYFFYIFFRFSSSEPTLLPNLRLCLADENYDG